MKTITIDLLKNHPNHIVALAKLWIDNLSQWDPNVNFEEVATWLHDWLNEDIPLAYIALDGQTPIGICSLQFNDGIRPDLMPWLGDLCVDKAYRNRNIGQRLIETVERKACELGFDKIYLFAPDATIPNYYMRLGWKKIAMDNYHGSDVTVMEFKLSGKEI